VRPSRRGLVDQDTSGPASDSFWRPPAMDDVGTSHQSYDYEPTTYPVPILSFLSQIASHDDAHPLLALYFPWPTCTVR
jgi:hypothetical protein